MKDEAPNLDIPNDMKPLRYEQQFKYPSEQLMPKGAPKHDFSSVDKMKILDSVNAPRK